MTQSQLRSKAAEAAGTEVERKADVDPLRDNIRKLESQFQMAMPKGMEAQQLVRDALTVISANPRLAECTPASVYGGLMTCAQLGLRPGVLGQAWLIPMKVSVKVGNSWRKEDKAQLVVGYQGFLALAHRSEEIASIEARIVRENDSFDYAFGLESDLTHKPSRGERGEAIAYYCIVKTRHEGVLWDVITRTEAEEHRDKFAMAKKPDGAIVGPWKDHFDSMALKTIVLRVLKLAPRSTQLMSAMVADGSVRIDMSPAADLIDVSDSTVIDGEIVDDEEPGAGDQPAAAPAEQAAATS